MSSVKPILLVLASTFPRWKGDTEPRFVYDLCQRLKGEYELIVLAPHCHGSQIQEELDGLQIIRYRNAPKAGYLAETFGSEDDFIAHDYTMQLTKEEK